MTSKLEVQKYAETANEMFAAGVNSFTAAELAKTHYDKGGFVAGKGAVADVKKALPRLRKLLEVDGHTVLPMSGTYFRTYRKASTSFHEKTPLEQEQIICQSLALGKSEEGVLRITDDDDFSLALWVDWESGQWKQGTGRLHAVERRVTHATNSGLIDGDDGRAITGGE